MAKRTKNQNTYYYGEWNADCDRCGFKFKASDLKEEWTGLMVCRDCWEPRHPADMYKYVNTEESVVPYTRSPASVAISYLQAEDGTYVTNPDGTFIMLEE